MTGININHNESRISANDDNILRLADKGAVKIGNGKYLADNENIEIAPSNTYEGCIRYNEEDKCLELCNGYNWIPLGGTLLVDDSIIWGMIFSGK